MVRIRGKRNRGFSLLELVIVVVIIGIIAAIAVPRMSRGAKGADESALKGDLAIMRSAIDLYAAEHGGNFPSGTAVEVASKLTQYSDVQGVTNVTKDTATGKIYGPYLKAIPPMPVGTKKNDATIVVVSGVADAPPSAGTAGWWYNSATGDIRANLADTELGDENKAYNLY
ncbi:MAG: type II secretion system protein [Planctomycetota bacterium]|jgi:prepilin-type N-terminal cleavage/methylation domain-containing protein